MYYTLANGIFSTLLFKTALSKRLLFALHKGNVHIRQETDRLVSIASVDFAELRGA